MAEKQSRRLLGRKSTIDILAGSLENIISGSAVSVITTVVTLRMGREVEFLHKILRQVWIVHENKSKKLQSWYCQWLVKCIQHFIQCSTIEILEFCSKWTAAASVEKAVWPSKRCRQSGKHGRQNIYLIILAFQTFIQCKSVLPLTIIWLSWTIWFLRQGKYSPMRWTPTLVDEDFNASSTLVLLHSCN